MDSLQNEAVVPEVPETVGAQSDSIELVSVRPSRVSKLRNLVSTIFLLESSKLTSMKRFNLSTVRLVTEKTYS